MRNTRTFKEGAKPNTKASQKTPGKHGSINPVPNPIDDIVNAARNASSFVWEGAKNVAAKKGSQYIKDPIGAIIDDASALADAMNPLNAIEPIAQRIDGITTGTNGGPAAMLELATDIAGILPIGKGAKTSAKIIDEISDESIQAFERELRDQIDLDRKNRDFIKKFLAEKRIEEEPMWNKLKEEFKANGGQVDDFIHPNDWEFFGFPKVKQPTMPVDKLIEDLVSQKNVTVFTPREVLDKHYEKVGGVDGLIKLREANNINQNVTKEELTNLGIIPTIGVSNYGQQVKSNLDKALVARAIDPITNPSTSDKIMRLATYTQMPKIKGDNFIMSNDMPDVIGFNFDNMDKYSKQYNDNTILQSSALHEIGHATNPRPYGSPKVNPDDYIRSEHEVIQRMKQLQMDAARDGVSPVYDSKTKSDFMKWLEGGLMEKIGVIPNMKESRYHLNKQQINYLIDKIVKNDTDKDIEDILLNDNKYV